MAGLIRQLFRQPACQVTRRSLTRANRPVAGAGGSAWCTATNQRQHLSPCRRHMSSRRTPASIAAGGKGSQGNDGRWQQRSDLLPADRMSEFETFPMVTANDLRSHKQRPRRVKMLLRDFVEDSLYNPHYGYFSKEAVIFSPGEPFNFSAMRDNIEFFSDLSRRYTEFEDQLDEAEGPNPTRQLWHTPTELFRPYYGESIARYLVANYHLTSYPYHDLIIYEMGAGRGTLMLNILDYIRDMDPQVYARTKYRVIEISSNLAQLQKKNLAGDHGDKVEIINKSIFDWNESVPSPCFFLAMEVWDNFPHDAIRYDLETETPLQAVVLIDSEGEFYEFYTPELDPVAARFFRVRDAATGGRYPRPYPSHPALRRLQKRLPMAGNLSDPEFIPTRLLQFFDVLERYFPAHRLLSSDFHSLPQAIKGLNAPVVQTRFERRMIPVGTPLVHQGYFDILFPTDFQMMESMYRAITGKLTRVLSHEEYMRRWAFVEDTETRTGENPS
ncbi:unnamed protein product [Parascedosporium putredinis]|uniref:Protein arginine methyltransferase NDUFAF7 n=1 Tax=Parascedosporium putredinis TaxID=1442378 RepID=A0A9P1HAX0_9PEZI|nr:unnamed protein product [Parascedosporium putredinis]CAI8003294.1 unnamed protein product [Parascedosporium putredinis]